MGSYTPEINHVNDHKDALKAMEDAGFPKDRAERALVASGHIDVASAIKWLQNHRDDPYVTEYNSRQYVLFLTPKSVFNDDLNTFWKESASQFGKNAVHDLFPHITLTRFFQVEDFRVPAMLEILDLVWQKLSQQMPAQLRLFSHKTRGYMALFLQEKTSDWLTELVRSFADKMQSTLGLAVPVHSGQFHLTLAYQFAEGIQTSLEKLAKNISLESSNEWELQLYSRDQRIASSKQIRIVIHPYASESREELSIIPGQHIVLDKEPPVQKGWLSGTCYETGRSGVFPSNYTDKSFEWKCWTMHRAIPVREIASNDRKDPRAIHEHVQLKKPSKMDASTNSRTGSSVVPVQSSLRSSGSLSIRKNKSSPAISGNSTLPRSSVKNTSPAHLPQSTSRKRRLFIMRHGERVDVTFGQSWISQYFDDQGGYHRRNLNMPKRLPMRNGGPNSFMQDSPITEIGACQAVLTGESLFAHNISISKVLASPAFRCLQTADAVMDGLKIKGKVKIDVEPALYEWLAWCKGKLPRWLTYEELLSFGVNINTKYKQFMKPDDFNMNESVEHYYNRTYNTMKSIIDKLGPDDRDVLIVGHAASLDVCTRQVTGACPRPLDAFVKIIQRVPFCGMSVIEEESEANWVLVQPPIPSLIHGNNHKFDWRLLQPEDVKKPFAV